MTIAEQITTAVNAELDAVHAAGIEQGKQAEREAFWDMFQSNGTRLFYSYAFGYVWKDEWYAPKYDIKGGNATALSQLFYYSGITDTKVTIDATAAVSSSYLFDQAKSLKTIRKIIVTEANLFSYWFRNCISLENLTIEGTIGKNGFDVKDCTLLTKASIESIMAAVSTTAAITVTFSKTAVNKAFETAEGANDGSTSAAWLALVGTRPLCTVALA